MKMVRTCVLCVYGAGALALSIVTSVLYVDIPLEVARYCNP
jgi:hypothetical protein